MLLPQTQAALTAVLLAAFGAMWQFDLYKNNDFSIVFVLFLLFLVSQSSAISLHADHVATCAQMWL